MIIVNCKFFKKERKILELLKVSFLNIVKKNKSKIPIKMPTLFNEQTDKDWKELDDSFKINAVLKYTKFPKKASILLWNNTF